jgi:AcrR family transcriptional regulator
MQSTNDEVEMNKRLLQKRQTRDLLLKAAKKCFIENGFLNTPANKIAVEAGVAHGTLFSHFKNKDTLILEIIDFEMNEIGETIQELIKQAEDVEDILRGYLNLIIREEAFFAVLAKEKPFYFIELRRKLIFRESVIRSYFFDKISEENSHLSDEEITASLNWLFAIINYYLANRELFASGKSVIKKFENSIIKTFKKIIISEEVNENS